MAEYSPTERGLALLEPAHRHHLLVAVIAVLEIACAAAAIGHDHAREPARRILKALDDAVRRHELQIVLMGADRQVCGPPKRGRQVAAVGTKTSAAG